MDIGLAERKRRLFVIISVPVIAAEERRSYSFDRVEDPIAIALIRRNPVIVAHGVGGKSAPNQSWYSAPNPEQFSNSPPLSCAQILTVRLSG